MSELSAYRLMGNCRKVVPTLIAVTECFKVTSNHVLRNLWKKMIVQKFNASLENGTQMEFSLFVDATNAMIAGGFISQDELSARLERATSESSPLK